MGDQADHGRIPKKGERCNMPSLATTYSIPPEPAFYNSGHLCKDSGNPMNPQQKNIIRLASFTELNPRPVVEINPQGKIIYQNPAAKKLFPDLGKKGLLHPYLSDFKALAKTARENSKALNRDIPIKNRWFRQFFYYLPDFHSVLVYGSDITDQKQKEADLSQVEKRYHLLFETMNYGYLLQDIIFNGQGKPADYRMIDANPAFEKLTRIKKEAILGKTANQLQTREPSQESIKSRKEYDRVAITGKPAYFESYHEALKKYFQLYAYRPNQNQIALIFSDITQRKKVDEEKNNFIAIMSHELRNPLTPIMANAQLLQSILEKQGVKNPLLQHPVNVIEKQAKVMANLLNDILDVSRLSRSKIVLKKNRINLCAVIRNAASSSMPFIETKNQALTMSFSQDPIYLQADPLRIEQIIVNILNNASKYTKPKGNISLRCFTQSGNVKIKIKDNGIGMSKVKIARIFDLFGDQSQPFMGIGGLGIGLNIVKNLVSLHQGTVTVESKGSGKGSKFTITLPLQKRAGAGQQTKPATAPQAPSRASRVLIVEDNADIRNAMGNLLRQEGHFIKTADTGRSALRASKAFYPDTALIDIGLPDMNGYKVAKLLKEQGRANRRPIKLIAFTGYGQPEDKKRSREAGFDHHLTKPVDIAHLIKLI
jgi:signal transduction histidine kinase